MEEPENEFIALDLDIKELNDELVLKRSQRNELLTAIPFLLVVVVISFLAVHSFWLILGINDAHLIFRGQPAPDLLEHSLGQKTADEIP